MSLNVKILLAISFVFQGAQRLTHVMAIEYDENVDDFQFTRTRPKRAKAAQAPPLISEEPEPEPEPEPRPKQRDKELARKSLGGENDRSRGKRKARTDMANGEPPKNENPARKSKRLSRELESSTGEGAVPERMRLRKKPREEEEESLPVRAEPVEEGRAGKHIKRKSQRSKQQFEESGPLEESAAAERLPQPQRETPIASELGRSKRRMEEAAALEEMTRRELVRLAADGFDPKEHLQQNGDPVRAHMSHKGRNVANGELHVPKQRKDTTKIALPFADTPVQRRNKEMRQGATKKGERRSSLGLRGRRASSLIDNGSNGMWTTVSAALRLGVQVS